MGTKLLVLNGPSIYRFVTGNNTANNAKGFRITYDTKQCDNINCPFICNIHVLGKDLLSAAEDGNLAVFRLALECPGANISHSDADGRTPLYLASWKGFPQVVQLILYDPYVDVNKGKKDSGTTALWISSHNGDMDIVGLLLNHSKIEVNKGRSSDGSSALYAAVQSRQFDIVKLLLNRTDIEVNQIKTSRSDSTDTSLIHASEKGYIEIVTLLVNHAQIEVNKGRTPDRITPLLAASINGQVDVVVTLLETVKIEVNKPSAEGKTALYFASEKGHLDVVKELLGHPQTDVNKGRTGDGWSPMGKASETGQLEIVRFLLNHPDINVNKGRTTNGETPLLAAAHNERLEIVRTLLNCTLTDVNKGDKKGNTGLMRASERGYGDIVKLFLAHPKLHVNKVTLISSTTVDASAGHGQTGGQTALFFASEQGHFDVMKLILKCPAVDTSMKDQLGWVAEDHYAWYYHLEIMTPEGLNEPEWPKKDFYWMAFDDVELPVLEYESIRPDLIDNGHTCCSEQVNRGMHIAAHEGNVEMVKTFLQCPNIDINDVYNSGTTPLYTASRDGHPEIIKELLARPLIKVNQILDTMGKNSLMIASEKGQKDVVILLLEHPKISLNRANTENGETALIIASEVGDSEIVEILLNHSRIAVNKVKIDGTTALIAASMEGHVKVAELLLRCPKSNVNLRDDRGKLAQDVADREGYREIAEAFQWRDSMRQRGQTCCLTVLGGLHASALEGDIEAIRGLLECPDADINFSDNKGRTLLYLASLHGHTKAVHEFLQHSLLDVSSADEGTFLFHLASMHGHATVVTELLDRYKLDVDRGTSEIGRTAFSIASEKGYFDILNLLITYDEPADFNKGWCTSNWTPKLVGCDFDDQQLKSTTAATTTMITTTTELPIGLFVYFCFIQKNISHDMKEVTTDKTFFLSIKMVIFITSVSSLRSAMDRLFLRK